VLQIEQEFSRQRSPADPLSDRISRRTGSIAFVIAHVVGFSGRIVLNSRVIPGGEPVDPYPFCFLALVVALEAIFLSTFVLMSQNRQNH
jgi:uncharacterized membrane protein